MNLLVVGGVLARILVTMAPADSVPADARVPRAGGQQPAAAEPAAEALKELFPGVRADITGRIVEVEATVSPMLVPDARAPRFYLEVLACSPGTREHETFFIVKAKPSHIHAALLASGFLPGHPGSIERAAGTFRTVDPAGERVRVRIVHTPKGSTAPVEIDPLDWIINAESVPVPGQGPAGAEKPVKDAPFSPTADAGVRRFADHEASVAKKADASKEPGWVFAGSRMVPAPTKRVEGNPQPAADVPEVYQADGTGVIIGLTTFGSEVIGWSRTISPDAVVQTPEWVADFSKTLPACTPVRIRITRAETRAPDRPAAPAGSSHP